MRSLSAFRVLRRRFQRPGRKAFIRVFLIQTVFLLCSNCFYGQNTGEIKGTVRNSAQEPLSGISIIIKGTQTGAVTDNAGRYAIVPGSADPVLLVSGVGYAATEIVAGGRSVIDITLQRESQELEDVVVVGYGRQKKINLTGAVEQVDSRYFENRPVPNASRSLQGAIPNLNIGYKDGRPTANPAYNIRGLTSIGAGGSALVLIDGVVGDPLFLNPNDIASVTVLKDAASAAIYGSRGAFGVVLITTKTASKSRPKIHYSGSYSHAERTIKQKMVTEGYLWAKMFKESYTSWTDYTTLPSTIGGSGLLFSSSYLDSLLYRSQHPGALPDVSTDPATGNYMYYGNTDWFNELYASSIPSTQHAVSVSGGTDKVDYAVSGNYYGQGGLYRIRGDQYHKYNLRVKGGVQATDWLRINTNNDFSNYQYTDPFNNGNIWNTLNVGGYIVPMAMLYNPDGSLTRTAAGSLGQMIGGAKAETNSSFVRNNISFIATLIKNKWSIRGDFSHQQTTSDVINKSVVVPYSVKPGEILTLGTSAMSNTQQKTTYTAYNLYTDFSQSFGKNDFKIMVGTNTEISQLKNLFVYRDNLLVPDLTDFNLAAGQNIQLTGGGNEWATSGVFSRINYSFAGKYLLELNGRYDGSSKFPASQQFGFFPSISAGWRVTEERFMKGSSAWLDNLKFRVSYGALGNSQIDPYLYVEQLKARLSPVVISGLYPAYITNPAVLADNFTWEKSTTTDFGMDIEMLKRRLSGSFDWYRRMTTDMITIGPVLPAVFGAGAPRGNYADLKTTGFELSVAWSDQIRTAKPVNYMIRLTLADNVSYITKYNNPTGLLAPDPNTFITNYYVGQRVGDIWGYTTEGLFASEEDIANHADQSAVIVSSGNKVLPGDIKFKDLNNDGKINKGLGTLKDHGDWSIIGNSTPRYSYGITTNVDWNQLFLSAFFQGIGKRDWYPSYGATEFWGQYSVWYGTIPAATLKNNWTLNGNDPNSYWPRYRGPMPYGERELQPQTRYLQNASYIRLKNLTVGYSLPKALLRKARLENVQVYLSGENIWTYTPMSRINGNIDPELISPVQASTDGNAYPILKTYTFGINIGL
ncbi:SusC/RagA family TonB-linked outer membrane protein [Niabella drilacis]|uniref:TonB-linked outer membrane protein, SusC/RagA family n=1 Tax=Niabella drilacis (strain DSM 25811 / CCM 8410 / CCUG 62505 / LMG 26954 / E90) TaxID=1285928 RepID=A0A1G6S513_NIADE|nr:TonB-dependent receptor [Niabella drilacis]SDD11781.1 TonB-linked outer membrane protein, SusC/RagA family [Niabella drilacis]